MGRNYQQVPTVTVKYVPNHKSTFTEVPLPVPAGLGRPVVVVSQ